MCDENSVQSVKCPICGSKDDCDHLLAVIDESFHECSGGYVYARLSEFEKLIETTFFAAQKEGDTIKIKCNNYPLKDLLDYIESNYYSYDDEDYIEIDSDLYFQSIVELFEADADVISMTATDDGGPGYSSSVELLYAEEPSAATKRALMLLSVCLGVNEAV